MQTKTVRGEKCKKENNQKRKECINTDNQKIKRAKFLANKISKTENKISKTET